eukprot:c12709_g1_i1 orf=150-554(+)
MGALSAPLSVSALPWISQNHLPISRQQPFPKSLAGLDGLSRSCIVCSAQMGDQRRKAHKMLLVPVAAVSTFVAVQQAVALVDERLSTEGTGLSLGVSNPLLIWILLAVPVVIWSLYFIFTSDLPQGDDDSGLSL